VEEKHFSQWVVLGNDSDPAFPASKGSNYMFNRYSIEARESFHWRQLLLQTTVSAARLPLLSCYRW